MIPWLAYCVLACLERVLSCLRLRLRFWLRRRMVLPSFCKRCGREVIDFSAPDWAWSQVAPEGSVLCYDCFAELGRCKGLPVVWRLEPLDELSPSRVAQG